MEVEGDEDDLDQFMEVVTMYRCKFCIFTATSPREMALHVKHTHIKKSTFTEIVSPVTSATPTSLPMDNNAKPSDNLILQSGNPTISKLDVSYRRTDALESIASEVNYDNNGIDINSTSESSQSLYTNLSPVSLPISTSNLSTHKNMIITLSNNNQQTVLEQTQSNIVPEVSSSEQQTNDYQFICQNSDGQYILQNSENVQIGTNGMVHVLVQDSGAEPSLTTDALTENNEESYMVAGSLNEPSSLETDVDTLNTGEDNLAELRQTDTQDDIVTKELYLCGNCSEGFASIQACKDHMTKIHEVTDFQTSCRVDAGTQVEPKKKPGRKKKSDLIEQVKTEPEDIVMSESDEDWAEQLMSYSTRSRRKRRPPQALKDDYYLGRTKRKEQKKREPKEQNVRCEKPGCGLGFKDEDTMRQHVQCHIEDADLTGPQFRCTACEEKFDTWRLVRHHLWKEHKISIDLLNCPHCPIYKTDTPSKLKIHLETHGSERAYACPVCGKTFKQFAQMKNHETCHLPQDIVNSKSMSDRWYTPKTCNICGRRFVNVKCMKKHKEVVHGGKKDFKCTYCSYECSRKAMLVLHLRIHTGHKPFKCDQCTYCCGDHNSLRRHKMRHTGQKPYRCPHCPYASIQAISLKVHVKNKHPGMGGIYCCDWCLYKTVNKQQYENHVMDHKNGLIKTEPVVKEIQLGPLQIVKIPETKRPGTMILGPNLSTVYTSVANNQNILQVLQTHATQNSNIQEVLQPHVTQNSNAQEVIETSGTQPVLQTQPLILEDGQVNQLQLQMNENNENVIVEEFGKEVLAPNDIAAAQLIYSTLTAISQNPHNGKEDIDCQGLVAGVESGDIQTSIETNLKEGVTTHTITFHLPEGEEITREVTLQDQTESKDGINVIQLAGNNEWQECDSIDEFQATN
ncbi:zinc finger and BTB domain-containing protein 24-like [Ruditapes philippinarum]|uniref:zinc finger and BTB domain-containing protein 24-like n=1 Tax=Ruditapes philippinarum TaxID=129788 RepID=UPI00295B9E50|nr:zinc finger and BTB domain-containing protein 24-like [Ruditapes philippinarum]